MVEVLKNREKKLTNSAPQKTLRSLNGRERYSALRWESSSHSGFEI